MQEVSGTDLFADEIMLRHVKRELKRMEEEAKKEAGQGSDSEDEVDYNDVSMAMIKEREVTPSRAPRVRSGSVVHQSPLVDRRRQK